MSYIPLQDAISMYRSRGLPLPESWNYQSGGNYMNGRVNGWGQSGPYVEAPVFGQTRSMQRPQPGEKSGSMEWMPGIAAIAAASQPEGFKTSWGTIQGAPVQNAGGGQSMFGMTQGLPGGAPQYQPPKGPLTQGQGMGQMPSMPRPFGNDYFMPGMPQFPQGQAPPPWLMRSMFPSQQQAATAQPEKPQPHKYSNSEATDILKKLAAMRSARM